MPNIKIFAGSSNPRLAEAVCKQLELPLGRSNISRAQSGEIHVSYEESIRNFDIFIVQSLSHPVNENLVELLVMIDAAKRASAKSVNIVMPYYGYARQERKAAPREPISAKMVADVLTTAGASRIITVDLHADAIQGFFKITLDHLTALDLIIEYLRSKSIQNPVVVSPDAGRATTAEKLAGLLDCPFAIMIKNRPAHNESEITHIIGEVEGMTPIIIEDLIDTGSTIINVVEALKKRGAEDAFICATHGLFSGDAVQKLNHPNIQEVVITDTISLDQEHSDKFVLLPMAPLLGTAIRIITEGGSIATLFKSE
ncbi:ribose-phosphate pyrophosphokinase [Paenibacillus sp. MY03]|jgi:ribose-phosphate pyrophosphokinase|uniref:Ribose-phosphate pyrophosphokinase n=1 Tax=Paenibacillus agaridevorans TaxID=171404 RepID=A0A2R5F6X9_9BACL|nr:MULTISPECIES: ribose-phosphate pyrophosphokinase [Paenibacillus]OUS77656.1 ribose-phosphate pyrophosphokinase [Paenibacillus sp. MY03]QNK55656.1 ribose-phosphate pyrophosphokinase [Paenibacillus sp. PAMC21692]GBG12334.1 ribose-phosphate pyrophosphokinase [Paenibacillus agaridevorans]